MSFCSTTKRCHSMPLNSKICPSLPILFLLLHLCAFASAAMDTISGSQSLSGNMTIVSKGGHFELGFFSPGNTGNFYIGIWFKNISERTVITWVANRENPVSSASASELKVSEDGNLVLLNQSKLPVWSSNHRRPRNRRRPIVAVLLDTGNLILIDPQNSSHVAWQSFSHPTDTILSGQWFGMNKITGVSQSRASWKNPQDPASGTFSNCVDPYRSSQYVLRWNKSRVYWQSGAWSVQTNPSYTYDYIDDDRQLRFRYTTNDKSIITRLIISVNGQLQRITWYRETKEWILQYSVPASLCDVYSVCGPFGVCSTTGTKEHCDCLPGFMPASSRSWDLGAWSEGCTRRTSLQCAESDKKNHGFLKISNMKLPESSRSMQAESIKECESVCLSNCTCTAYAYERECVVWNTDLQDLKQLSVSDGNTGGVNLYIRLAASDLPFQGTEKKVRRMRLIASLAAGGTLIMISGCVMIAWILRKRRVARQAMVNDGPLVLFDYAYLRRCTKNFSDKLGEGSFGSVFQGVLSDKTTVAVKKLQGMRQGEKQFQTEVRTLGRIQHTNLVRLRGFCFRGAERLLVYDYMPNGSLDSHLFKSNVKVLDWKTRFQVILGIAKGLAYLHEECHECIVHCDVKPENILLDIDLTPKVTDFGLAKLISRDFSRALTTARGTVGYLAPEWLQGLAITQKADVYSYGMMLFEIISGRRNRDQMEDGDRCIFPVWAAMQISEGRALAVLDDRLNADADVQELGRACRAACWCIQDDEACRPTMREVVQILHGTQKVGLAPVPWSLRQLVQEQDLVLRDFRGRD